MQIQSTSNLNFQKIRKYGLDYGRRSRSTIQNPYDGKLKKALNWYKKEVINMYNATDKKSIQYNLNYFDVAYDIRVCDVLRRHVVRGKAPLEY